MRALDLFTELINSSNENGKFNIGGVSSIDSMREKISKAKMLQEDKYIILNNCFHNDLEWAIDGYLTKAGIDERDKLQQG